VSIIGCETPAPPYFLVSRHYWRNGKLDTESKPIMGSVYIL